MKTVKMKEKMEDLRNFGLIKTKTRYKKIMKE